MKKWLSVAALVVLCLALVIGIACGEEEEEGVKEVKWGIGLPLTGIYGAVVGIPAKQGYELANEYLGEFTVAGERYKWNLIFEDNHWSAEGGLASATKLIFEDDVNIMSQTGGDPGLTAQTLCEESGVILFAMACGEEAFGPDKPHTFEGSPMVYNHSAAIMKYISETHPEVKTASALTADAASERMLAWQLSIAAEYYGIEWLKTEYYPLGPWSFIPLQPGW